MHRILPYLLLISALILGACRPAPAPAAPAPADSASDSGLCGDRSRLDSTLNLYNWADYMDEAILKQFQAECGVRVVMDTYGSNEDLLAKLQAGATGYDVIVPSDYMVNIMIQLEMLRPLDHANLPNLVNLDPRFTQPPYDPGNIYSVPYQWGTSGLAFDLDALGEEPTGWAALFDPAQAQRVAGRFSLLNDMRETIGAALKYLGYSFNSTDPAELEAAKQVILAIKPYVATFESDAFKDLLASGDTVLAHGWSGDAFQAIYAFEERNLGYIIPEEGAIIWTDNMVIPKSAPHPYTAEVFINFMLEAEVGAALTNYVYYASPNQASRPFIDAEVLENPGIFPPDEVMERLEFLDDLGEATLLWERIWTEVKSE